MSRIADAASARGGKWALAAAIVAAAVVSAAAVGRWERDRQIDAELRGLRRVETLVGPLDRSLYGYRVLPQFDCLVYRRGVNILALELCVDRAGRLVEAVDRLAPVQRYYSLRADPADSTIWIDRAEVDRLLRKMGAE